MRLFKRLLGVGLGTALAASMLSPVPARAAEPVYSLHLSWVFCIKRSERVGYDEIYVKVNGQKVWGTVSIDVQQSKDMTGTATHYFSAASPIKVELWEKDPGADDLLGRVTISTPAELGWINNYFNGDGGQYYFSYDLAQVA